MRRISALSAIMGVVLVLSASTIWAEQDTTPTGKYYLPTFMIVSERVGDNTVTELTTAQCTGATITCNLFPETETESYIFVLPKPTKGLGFRARAGNDAPGHYWILKTRPGDALYFYRGAGNLVPAKSVREVLTFGDAISAVTHQISETSWVWIVVPEKGTWTAE